LLRPESSANWNASNLYDPSTVTLIDGQEYHFKEGTLAGRGQKFHAHHVWMDAVLNRISSTK
jgi:hypothetical protein